MFKMHALILCTVFLLSAVGGEIVTLDMSYEYAENKTMYFNPNVGFRRQDEYKPGYYEAGFWLASYTFFTAEHGGSHMDAPFHFAENGRTVEQIKLSELLKRPAVKIDIAARAKTDPDTMVTVEDLEMWEKKHGRIPEGAAVLMFSGWQEKYGDWQAFMGVEDISNINYDFTKFTVRHYPGFSKEAMDWLCTERNIAGVGVDTVSIDRGLSKDAAAHTSFASHDKWGLEMVANLKELPENGALFSVLPMKMAGGTGGPSRMYATWDTTPGGAPSLRGGVQVIMSLLTFSFFAVFIRS